MKDNEKKVTEETKTEKNSAPLTDEELEQVAGGAARPATPGNIGLAVATGTLIATVGGTEL